MRGLHECNPLDRFKCPSALEAQAKSEPEDTFVNAFTSKLTRARDYHKIRIRHVGIGRSGEMRRIRRIKGFNPELELDAFRDAKLAEDA